MMAEVRAIAPADLPGLIPLCREHAAYEGAEFVENGQADRLGHALFGTPPALFGWVVEDAGVLVGYMTATREYATWPAEFFVHMDCLYLRDAYRGRGLGRRLLTVLADFADSHGCRLIQWQTPPGNQLGIGFYERLGARAKDKKRYFYDRDHWSVTSPNPASQPAQRSGPCSSSAPSARKT